MGKLYNSYITFNSVIMSSEKELEELSKPEFWDNRYAEHIASPDANGSGSAEQAMPSFEWFRDYNKLRAFFQKWLPRPGGMEVILHLGCGNSVCFPLFLCLIFSVQVFLSFYMKERHRVGVLFYSHFKSL